MTTTATAATVTWGELVTAEPRLADLLTEVKAIRDDRKHPSFCANRVWFGWLPGDQGLKGRMSRLVGWDRHPDPILGTSDAFRVAYRTLYDALPDCRNCLCVDREDYL